MTIDEILFDQYILGREDEAMAWCGDNRKPGGEITKAKKLVSQPIHRRNEERHRHG